MSVPTAARSQRASLCRDAIAELRVEARGFRTGMTAALLVGVQGIQEAVFAASLGSAVSCRSSAAAK